MMLATARPPAYDRWRDVEGTHICLFSRVEQVTESPQLGVLPSRLHQHGQVVGRSLDSLYVRFEDNALVSLPPHLLRRLPDTLGEC
jgi:hypothetical protein